MQMLRPISPDTANPLKLLEKPSKAKDSGKLVPCNPPQETSTSRTQIFTQESELNQSEISETPIGPWYLPTFIPSKTSDRKAPSLEDFSMEKEIGRGAFATVRLAYLPESRSYFAAKIYSKQKLQEPYQYNSLQSEIKILQQIDHPNVVKLKYVLENSSHFYLMLEHVQGVPLNEYLRKLPGRKCTEEQAKYIFRQIVSAVGYCHSRNICHRDIKLENVLIDNNNRVKLIDFGFSTCFDKNRKVKMFCGTLSYMAAEIVQKVEYAGPPADIWACGVLLYALVSGSFPFKAAFDKEIIHRIYRGDFNLPTQFTQELQDLIRDMMDIDPDKRPNASHVLTNLWVNDADRAYEKIAIECDFKRVCAKGLHLFEKFAS